MTPTPPDPKKDCSSVRFIEIETDHADGRSWPAGADHGQSATWRCRPKLPAVSGCFTANRVGAALRNAVHDGWPTR